LDEASLERARDLVGLKGYVTNIPASVMPPAEVLSSYHDLWQVEQSFRMSKSDLQARPMFHRQREAIEAHLTIVFASLAMSRILQNARELIVKLIITTLRPIQSPLLQAGVHTLLSQPQIPEHAATIIEQITVKSGH